MHSTVPQCRLVRHVGLGGDKQTAGHKLKWSRDLPGSASVEMTYARTNELHRTVSDILRCLVMRQSKTMAGRLLAVSPNISAN